MDRIPLRQAKPNAADLAMAKALLVAFQNIIDGYMPESDGDDGEPEEEIAIANDEDAAKALLALLQIYLRGSLDRCVWTLSMLMDPKNMIVNPDVSHVEVHPRIQRAFNIVKRLAEWKFSSDAALLNDHAAMLDSISDDAQDLWAEYQEAVSDGR